MYWYILFYGAVTVLALAVVVSVILFKSKTRHFKFLNSFNVLFGGVFIASGLMLACPQYMQFLPENFTVLKTVIYSVLKTISLFGASDSFKDVFEVIPETFAFSKGYTVLALLLQISAPLLSVGFLLSFFKNLSAYIIYFFNYFNDIYVFSEINKKSIVLAKDISEKYKNARIIFARAFDKNNKQHNELVNAAREFKPILFMYDIGALNLKFHSKNKSINFFAINGNDTVNINYSLELIAKYKKRDNTRLYIFSDSVQSDLLLSGQETGKLKLRRIDEVRSKITHILYEEGEKIFKNAYPIANNEKQISAVVVGMGKHGTEMLKALSWFCQMDGYRVKINAFDSSADAEERFSANCPELMSDKYNRVYIEGEAQYDITVHSGVDVESNDFAEIVTKLENITYAIISLGSDELNISTAVKLRMLCERIGAKPIIQAIVCDSKVKKALQGVKNYRGQAYDIDFIGDLETSYSESVIIDSAVEQEALQRHLKWGSEEEFWKYEYNYRSSVATAVHRRARSICGISGADKAENELTSQERHNIEMLEHRRWNAYMRAEGYVYSGSKDSSTRNDLAKMHHDLVDYASLSDEEKRKDSKVATK